MGRLGSGPASSVGQVQEYRLEPVFKTIARFVARLGRKVTD